MGSRLLLHICALLCLGGGYASAEDPGMDFAFFPNVGNPYLEVLLTAFFPDTQATIQLPNKNYRKVVSLAPKLPLAVELPAQMEIHPYSPRSNSTVRITSNKPISVVAINSQLYQNSVTVLTPIADWGTDYYVVTPDIGFYYTLAIVNGPQSNFVSIHLRGMVVFENTEYSAGEYLKFTLNPWETVLLQEDGRFTGSRVLSQEPIAVFSGCTCAGMHDRCQVLVQLPPISAWGSKFVSPPLPFQKFPSKIYILAATKTEVNIVRGLNMTNSSLTPGVVEAFDLDPMTQLLILSPGKILVFLCVGNGDPFFANGFFFNLVPREKACASYSIPWVPGFRQTLLVVVQEDGREGLQLNHEDLPQSHWENIPGTDLVYTLLPLYGFRDYYSMYNPRHVFDASIIGTSWISSFGVFGVCLDKVYNLCGFECTDELPCQQTTCMSPEIQTCVAWGRTHMRTFQGTYHFQSGDCPLTLLASRGGDANFVSFRLARRADYKFTVKLEVFGMMLEISAKSPGAVLVNGALMYTPIVLEDGKLNITNFGLYISVKTSFGLHVILGDLDFVQIQIPHLYSGGLSGLCANQHPTEWSTFAQHNPLFGGTGETNLNCNSSGLISPKLCENQDMSTHLTLCTQMVTSKIFEACHSALDPEPFVEACKSEVCATGNVCLGLGAYALACDLEKVNMTGWQSLTGCDYSCPPNSYYSMCALGCPATCVFNFSLACPVKCHEGCVCNPGYVLDDGCVLEEKCGGCSVDGHFLKNGEVVYGDGCKVACTCTHGKLACANHNCSPIEGCQTIGGITACYPKPISCWVSGEKRHTFDGASLAHGECLYTMVTTQCAFSNITDLDIKFQLTSNMLLPDIRLKIRGHTIVIPEYRNGIEVDGITYPLPFSLENVIRVSGNHFGSYPYIHMEAEPGLILIASHSTVWVNLPPAYAGHVCGLCGNANGDPGDDTEGGSPQEFLSIWTSHRDNNLCGASPEIFDSDVDPFNMTGGDVDLFTLTALCDEILIPEGAFRNCRDVLSPTWFFHTCLNFVSSGLVQSVCSTIKDYAFECRTMGVTVYQWENETVCDHFGA